MVNTVPSNLNADIGSNQVLKLWVGMLSLIIWRQLFHTSVQVFSILII